jgi:hypothetical protein
VGFLGKGLKLVDMLSRRPVELGHLDLRDPVHGESMLPQYLKYIDPLHWLPSLVEDINVGNRASLELA